MERRAGVKTVEAALVQTFKSRRGLEITCVGSDKCVEGVARATDGSKGTTEQIPPPNSLSLSLSPAGTRNH